MIGGGGVVVLGVCVFFGTTAEMFGVLIGGYSMMMMMMVAAPGYLFDSSWVSFCGLDLVDIPQNYASRLLAKTYPINKYSTLTLSNASCLYRVHLIIHYHM